MGRKVFQEKEVISQAWGYERLWLMQRRLRRWAIQPQHGSARKQVYPGEVG